jgi:16S rRNA (cytidine1402-2'-O)-methyltransferase
MAGTLFVVATPIGNLEDLTFRAMRTLREVDLIAAEDTRRTAKLLAHYEIRKPLVSLREHNEVRETPRLLARLEAGTNLALVSDAGTPGIADPGARLVRAALNRGLSVVPIPGANAIATALSAAGVPADSFVFMGFPPATGTARQNWFNTIRDEPRTVVFFEAPHRSHVTIGQITYECPNRSISIFRELTKKNEELVELHNYRQDHNSMTLPRPLGEFTVVVHPTTAPAKSAPDVDLTVSIFGQIAAIPGVSDEDAVLMLAKKFDTRPSSIRSIIKKAKILAKRQGHGSP